MSEPVLTLADLAGWSFRGTALAVLGQPIRHSISPAIHNAALQAMSVAAPPFGSWRYFRFEVAPADLPVALARLHACGFAGLNLTVPHKVLAVPAIEAIEPAARDAGAVNTLLRTERGWRGFNTDGFGLSAGLRDALAVELAGRPVILLGAGGAGRGAAVQCLRERCASLWIGNRSAANLDALLAALAPLRDGIPVRGFPLDAPPDALPAEAVVINATTLGLRAGDPAPVALERLPRPAAVYEMIYNPAETALLRAARTCGVPAANGLSMLVHQGARALEIWTRAKVPVEVMRRAAARALANQ